MAEYDEDGWHLDPYVSREFYGVWGSFDVKITIDSSYVVASTGYLKNPREVGHGYCQADKWKRKPGRDITWHFVADSIHDFAWAADPDYVHTHIQMPNGPLLRFFHVANDTFTDSWEKLPELTANGFNYLSTRFGKYPYGQYSVVQAGDGGMEYPMATFITGRRYLGSLFGVVMHEAAHSWYQLILGTNEARHHWMDEGFTNYAGNVTFHKVMYPNGKGNPHERSMASYLHAQAEFDILEPLCTHADHFVTNAGYGNAAYSKGELFLVQLEYVVGEAAFNRTMKDYFNKWGFRHPRPEDFLRIAENRSGLILDWFLEYWIHSTKHIDYAVVGLKRTQGKSYVVLERKGPMPMPVEVVVLSKTGDEYRYYVPLDLMQGSKGGMAGTAPAWMWVAPRYELEVAVPKHKIASVYLDFKGKVADIDPANDRLD
jgi:aminopeptidase N